MIDGLFETHIHVTNLENSMKFYEEVLGLEFAHIESERRVAFYWMGNRGDAMLGVWEKPVAEVQRQHFAFRSSVENILEKSVDWLHHRNLEARNFFNDGSECPMVFGWMPAIAIYFQDPDGHSLEFISMLPGEPRPDLGVITWEAWQEANQAS